MRDELTLGFARPYQIVASSHTACESALNRPLDHGDAFLLVFAARGRLDVSRAASTIPVGAGEALLLAPDGVPAPALSYGRETEFDLVRFLAPAPPGRARRRIEVPEHVAIRNPARMKHILRLFMEEARGRAGSPLVLHHLVVLMLCEMAASCRVGTGARCREDSLESIASRVDAYIAAHYHEAIGTPDIARELRYNPDYLERAYRAERGGSIREAIQARRFREAQAQLLLQRARGIAEIAALCGFPDPGYFRRVFKRATNLTPRGFRMLHADRAGASAAGAPAPGAPAR